MHEGKHPGSHHSLLADIARQAMIDRGLEPEFPPAVEQQLEGIQEPATPKGEVRDLRKLLWCSIDNDDSPALDQLTVAEALAGANTRLLVPVPGADPPLHNAPP